MCAHPLPDGVLVILADVTTGQQVEDGHLQDQLHQSQKLESLAVLVGGVAHDFSNLLVGMLNGSELLVRDLPEQSALRGTAEMIHKAGLCARDVAQQLLVFVGKGQAERQPFALNPLIRETVELLESAFTHVTFHSTLYEELPPIYADPGQMQQVVLNLLMNAAEALSAGGTIRAATGLVGPSETDCKQTDGAMLAAREYIFVEVADDGHGMSPEVQAQIFEPFFTTKPTGRGLGLAAVKNIIGTHNGLLRLTSTPGAGSKFRIYLPSIRLTVAVGDSTASNAFSRRVGSVLIVDDEVFVRDVVSRLLHKAGIATQTASNGQEALALVPRQPGHRVGGVRPEDAGNERLGNAARASGIRPHLQVIVSSGYPGDDLNEHAAIPVVGFLPKPYIFEDVLRLVQQGLARSAP